MMVELSAWCLVLVVFAVVAPAAAVVGGEPAAPPEPDAAVVFVQRNGRSARIEGLKDDRLGYYSFYGIRYAEPPMGQRRFQRASRRYLAGELMATKQCLPCPQKDPYRPERIIGDEDCLCINVFAPKMPGDEKGSPVVFFIHGGNYRSGSTSAYGGQHFTQKDTILVTAQYRLGALGYLSTGQKDASGNLGLFDLHTAMIWINEYIEFFGGDKDRVILMGQGSGGSAASLLALSPEGRSATGVAAMSGTPLSPGAVRSDPQKHASALANKTGCPSSPAERLVICLKKMPIEKVVLADSELNMDGIDTVKFLDDISGRSGAGARVEGADDLRALPPLVIEPPAESLKKNNKRVPLLTGVTSAETSRVVYGKYNKFLTNQLQSVKDFIKKDLIGGLQSVVSGVEGLLPITGVLNQVLPLSNYYQAIFETTTKAVDGLSQIAEATGDALFNFPAYQTVNAWSSGGNAFLYSFEHVGNLSKGNYFLPGVPLAEQSNGLPEGAKLKGPAHGDELAYLFEPLDAEGKPVGGEVSSTDARARDSFVGLITKFAHQTSGTKKGGAGGGTGDLYNFFETPFNKKNDQFLKITDEVNVGKEFRFCQMGIWGNIGDRLTSALCKNLITDLLGTLPIGDLPLVNGQIPLVPGQNSLVGQTGSLLGQTGSLLGQSGQGQAQQQPNVIGGLGGSLLGQTGQVQGQQQMPNTMGGLGGLGGSLLGQTGRVQSQPQMPNTMGGLGGSALGPTGQVQGQQQMPNTMGGLGGLGGSLLGQSGRVQGQPQMSNMMGVLGGQAQDQKQMPNAMGGLGGSILGQTGRVQGQQQMPNTLGGFGGFLGGQRSTTRSRQQQTPRQSPRSNLMNVPIDF